MMWSPAVCRSPAQPEATGARVCDPQHVRLRAGYQATGYLLYLRCRCGSQSRAPEPNSSKTSNTEHPTPNEAIVSSRAESRISANVAADVRRLTFLLSRGSEPPYVRGYDFLNPPCVSSRVRCSALDV